MIARETLDLLETQLQNLSKDLRFERTNFPSGNIWFDIWRGDDFYVIEFRPLDGVGVSKVSGKREEAFQGHDFVTAEPGPFQKHLRELLGLDLTS